MLKQTKTSLATKLSLTFAALFLITMLSITYVVRQIILNQFKSLYEQEVVAAVNRVQGEFLARHEMIKQHLRQFGKRIADDHYFRLHAVVRKNYQNSFLVDYASSYIETMRLRVLEIADGDGIVLSSGHARNTFGRQISPLIRRLNSLERHYGLVWFEEPDRRILCVAAIETVILSDQRFYIIGGLEVTPEFLGNLEKDSTNFIFVQLPQSMVSSSPKDVNEILSSTASESGPAPSVQQFYESYSVGEFALPLITNNSVAAATVYLLHPKVALNELLNNLNWRILMITGIGIFVAIILSVWLSRSVAKPLQRLATTAGNLSMDTLDAHFDVSGNDEVGVLGAALRDMQRRLRRSRLKLAVAEKKAALAEMARQVNHDIKNGFIPIRNVMEHWQEVAATEGHKLVDVFNERKTTVIESINYLEELARSYSRLHLPVNLKPVDINLLLSNLVESYHDFHNGNILFHTNFDNTDAVVHADEVQLRRAFENVLQNAVEAIHERGQISVTTVVENSRFVIEWRDTGEGIPKEIQKRLFEPHITTKEGGTGLGLSNVKSILNDFGGTVTIRSQQGEGTTVRMTLPNRSNMKKL
jgi:signal transduction histidine kinase